MVNAGSKAIRVEVKIKPSMIPLSCPMPNMSLWDMHPKVYLPFNEHNLAVCPYCDTYYVVADE